MIRCMIVDDEPLASKLIATYIKPIHNLELLKICYSGIDAANYLNEHEIDLIFLDINMPEISGMDFLKSLNISPLIIITTAHREFAVESFELDVVDYLIKPITLQRFMKTISRVNKLVSLDEGQKKSEAEDSFIFLKVDKKMVKVKLNDICYIESLKDYIRVKTIEGSYVTHQTLTHITELLASDNFVRIHRSFTVSLKMVTAIDGNRLEIKEDLLPIGRNYQQQVKSLLFNSGVQ
jgi:DNA-binding LytR/AlgR family response regulator